MLSGDYLNSTEFMALDWKLDDEYNDILSSFVSNKDMNITSIYDEMAKVTHKYATMPEDKKGISYKKVQRRTTVLFNRNLITKSSVMHIDNLDKDVFWYRLTLNGVFYVIINWFTTALFIPSNKNNKNFFISLLKYHSDNALFQLFLFPYFEEKTLNELSSSGLFVEFMDYLKEICKIVIIGIRGMYMIPEEELIEGMFPQRLFSWPMSYPDDKLFFDRHFEKGRNLRKFLSMEMGWNWIDNAQINPNYNDDIITIKSKEPKSDSYIRIDRIKNEAYLAYDKKKYNLRLSKEIDNTYSILAKGSTNRKDLINEGIKQASKRKLLDLIFSIKTNHQHPSLAIYHHLLNNDKKFRDTVNEMIEIIKANDQN